MWWWWWWPRGHEHLAAHLPGGGPWPRSAPLPPSPHRELEGLGSEAEEVAAVLAGAARHCLVHGAARCWLTAALSHTPTTAYDRQHPATATAPGRPSTAQHSTAPLRHNTLTARRVWEDPHPRTASQATTTICCEGCVEGVWRSGPGWVSWGGALMRGVRGSHPTHSQHTPAPHSLAGHSLTASTHNTTLT